MRQVHVEIRNRIERALGNRNWSWLAARSGVPPSTLSNQRLRPRFSIDVLVAIADALERPVAEFLPDDIPGRD